NACCPGAVCAAIGAVKAGGVKKGVLVTYTTSYDVRPDSSFVGYAGVVY
ncbi:MAG: AmmeMemoRadiSam system protein B, partial [Spirochaetes bacterium]|nr:AmmeMemoRadiSam system protein B [Spirochaetota bacterium]